MGLREMVCCQTGMEGIGRRKTVRRVDTGPSHRSGDSRARFFA